MKLIIAYFAVIAALYVAIPALVGPHAEAAAEAETISQPIEPVSEQSNLLIRDESVLVVEMQAV